MDQNAKPNSDVDSRANDRLKRTVVSLLSRAFRSEMLALLLVLGFGLASGSGMHGHTLIILVDSVSNTNGVVGVLVFNSSRGWPNDNTRAFRAVAVPARRGSITIRIHDLPAGVYAVVVLHDENENRRLDRTWVGLPKEQWGMSNNPPVHFSAPSFKQARFIFSQDEKIHIIFHWYGTRPRV